MSLRHFHLLFVAAALLRGVLTFGWSLGEGAPLLTFASAISVAALAAYAGLYFLRVLRPGLGGDA